MSDLIERIDRANVGCDYTAHALLTEARNEIEALRERALKAEAATAAMYEASVYSDSYGIPGSEFMCCRACMAGGAPGVEFKHDAHCPVGQAEKAGEQWWREEKEREAENETLRKRVGELEAGVKFQSNRAKSAESYWKKDIASWTLDLARAERAEKRVGELEENLTIVQGSYCTAVKIAEQAEAQLANTKAELRQAREVLTLACGGTYGKYGAAGWLAKARAALQQRAPATDAAPAASGEDA